MSTIDDSCTFLSRRSRHSQNYRHLPLNRVDIDSKQIPLRGKTPSRLDHSLDFDSGARSPLPQAQFSKFPLVKMKRFSDLVNYFYESKIEDREKRLVKNQDQVRRDVINKDLCSSYRDREKSVDIGAKNGRISQSIEKRGSGVRLKVKKEGMRSRLERRQNSEIPSRLGNPNEKGQGPSNLRESMSKNRKPEEQQCERQGKNDSPVKKWSVSVRQQPRKGNSDSAAHNNPQESFTGNFDVTLEKILQEYGIKNQKELEAFLSENQYLQSVHKSTSHARNILLASRTPISEYDTTYRQYKTIEPTSLNATNYECLPQLHLKKPSIANLKTSNCWQFYQKPIAPIPFNIPQHDYYSPIEQISYKTSYQHAFSQLKTKSRSKHSELFKPNNSTFVHGSQFTGTTQYNKDYKQPEEKLIDKPKDKFMISELEYNKHKNGDSHNTFTTKGFQLLKTAYKEQFKHRESPYLQTSLAKQSDAGYKSQSIDNYKMPAMMYESSNLKSFQPEEVKGKNKPITPWKYHLMCQLKALLAMDKEKKQGGERKERR